MDDPAILNPGWQDGCVIKEGRKNCIVSDRLFLFLNLSLFSVCTMYTCTGYKKECNGDVCKCKNGYVEDPAILNPGGQDDCVVKESRKNCIFSDRLFFFHCV